MSKQLKIFSSFGGAPFEERTKKIIRLILKGCTNRPFFHISVQEVSKTPDEPVIEQLGNYDPLPNKYNEKLVAINFKRLQYWLRKGAEPTVAVQKLLGLCGYFPVHPASFEDAYIRRKEIITKLEKLKTEAANLPEKEAEVSDNSSSETSEEQIKEGTSQEQIKEEVTEEPQTNNAPDDGKAKT